MGGRITDETMKLVGAERKAEEVDDPQHAHDAHTHKVLHQHCEDVLAPNHASVEEGKTWGHEQHERRGRHHPRGVAAIQFHLTPVVRLDCDYTDTVVA